MTEVADSYIDVWGKPKQIDPATREALLRALGPARPALEWTEHALLMEASGARAAS